MPATPLPPLLERKLADLAASARWLLVVRGLSCLALATLGGAALAVGLDAAFNLPAWVRGVLLCGWLVWCGLVAWRLVVRPWRDGVPASELAGLLERYFPGLSERLTTLVELNDRADPGNGSRALIGVLARETDQRTRRLDFARVAPTRPAVGLGSLALAVSVLLLAPLAVVPGSGERVRRFVLPWYTPPADVAYRVVVSSGDPVVRRGEAVTLSAYLEPTRPAAALPNAATLVVRGAGSTVEKALPMTGVEGSAFHLTLPGVADDFEYRVQAGPARSEWHAVLAADPVALADGTTLTVHPPGYAEGIVPFQVRDGFAEFDVLQFGRAVLDLRFSSAPAEVYLEWRPADPGNRVRVPVRLRDDRLAGSAEVAVPTDGTLVLVLIGDRGVRTELPAAVRATPDAPPRFEKVVGLTGAARDVRPDERVPIELAARDDVRIESLHVEYCLNSNEADVRSEPVALPGVGSNRAEGAFAFALAGKAKEGETLLFRVRASDNRAVPDRKLGPQHAVFPPSGWAVLRVTASARPLVEQEVLGQRDKVRDRLADAVKLVQAANADVTAVKAASSADGALSADQSVRLRRSREAAADAGRLLEALADEAALTPDLRPLATAVREVTAGPLRVAGDSIRAAETDQTQTGRDKALAAASDRLTETLAKLAELDARNEKTAQTRLDRHTLRQIADDEAALADRANGNAPADELSRTQRDLIARLNEVVARSEPLRAAMDAAAGVHLHDLLARVRKLAEDYATLDRAVRDTEQAARLRRTEELARRQRDLSAEAARLATRTEAAARQAVTAPLARQPFDRAAEELARGDTDRALTEQEKAAGELDRLAEAFARAAAARGDIREAARQIARWQDDLRRRYTDATPTTDEQRKPFLDEQRVVREAVERLRRPGADTELARIEQAARDTSRDAAEALARKPADAPAALQRAVDALTKLADRMPSLEERTRQAKVRLDELRKAQEEVSRGADEAVRQADRDALGRKLDATAARQDALARKLRDLDVPGHELRRNVVAAAARSAAADLRAGLLPDVPISQQEVRRQLNRLRQAVDGTSPTDEQAVELARLQGDVADAAAHLPAKPTADQLQSVQKLQREVARRLGALNAPEATGPLAAAKEAVGTAEDEVRKADRPDELRKKTREAADAMTRLANRLSGAESELDRVERLARESAARAKQFERQPADAEATSAARRQLDELELTRTGKAQAARQQAVDALRRLRQSGTAAHQRDAADALRRLADEMARHGDRSAALRPAGPPAPTAADELRRLTGAGRLPTDRDAAAAKDLARRQRELRDAVSEAAVELARGVRASKDDALGRAATNHRKRQEELVAEADRLRDALRGVSDEASDSPLGQAATATDQAREQMSQAAQGAATGRAQLAAEARARAGAALARAIADAARAAGSSPTPTALDRDALDAGGAVRRAGDQMRHAESQIGKPNGNATGSMRRAADALTQAAGALSRSLGGRPAAAAPPPGSAGPRTDTLPAEVVGRFDRPWGELPGDVRSQIIQELAAKYGEDYARSIKLYFESLAERK
ncbi:MAG TPA: hypothetical protein VFG68_03800 [Fimbriiglobus sp.]|nr:hypothetical protein [Fimbriiglobus sp.]